MLRRQRSSGGTLAGWLLIAAGLLTVVNNFLPGAAVLDTAVLAGTGGTAVVVGALCLLVPWERLPPRSPLLLALLAFALISVSDAYGGVSSFSYGVFFVVVFVWVGLTQAPRTGLWLAPAAAAAYLAPLLADAHPPTNAVSSSTVVIPVCVLVAETLARQVQRLQESRTQLRQRIGVVERLAALTGELGRGLDLDSVQRRLVDAACELVGAEAVLFGAVSDDQIVITAAAGATPSILGIRVPLRGSRLAVADAGDGLCVAASDDGFAFPPPAGGTAITVACRAGSGELLGGITVLLTRPASQVTAEEQDLLRLLAGQASAALLNAATHRSVVEQREHEQAVIDVLADGVIVLRPDGTVASCNAAAAALLGAEPGDLLGRRPPIDLTSDTKPVLHQARSGLWLEALPALLPGTGDTVVALRDMSRQRALDDAKDLFLATASHELRTPLTAIKGWVQTLQRRWDSLDEPMRIAALATVERETEALITLTDHLLLGARAGSSRHTGPRRAFDLGAVAEQVAHAHAGYAEHHRIVADVPPGLPAAMGDGDGMTSALGQLVENAVKYSPGGGEVMVRVRVASPYLVVEVLDRGIGIPPGREDTLFAPFEQAGSGNTREYGGVGLGLYIVKQLVEAHGGRVSARNRDGGGAVMRIELLAQGLPIQRSQGLPDVRHEVRTDGRRGGDA